MSEIEQIPSNAEMSKLDSMRMKHAWLANNRPDTVLEIAKVAQVPQSYVSKGYEHTSQELKKETKYVHDHKASIHIP